MDIKKEKRELIIQAAIKVFGKEGFHPATISTIAEVAGIGKGTIYEYFDSKTQLYEEMIKYTIEIFMEQLDSVLSNTSSARESFKKFIKLTLDVTKDHMDIGRVYATETIGVGENILNIMLSAQKRVIEMLEDLIKKGILYNEFRPIDTRMAALSFLGSVKYTVMHFLFTYKRGMSEEEIENFVDLYIEGLKK